MALNKEQMREYMRKRRAEKREKNPEYETASHEVEIRAAPGAMWDKKKYPNRGAWEIAVGRVERAVRWARKFPNHIYADDLKFQTLDWQYQNEGLKAPAS